MCPSKVSLKVLSSHVSALFRNYEHNGLMYIIDISTHFLLLFNIISLFQSRFYETWVVGLINKVIIVTYFDWDQHSVFDIVILTCECAVSRLQTLWSCVCP